ncbi:MAG TPA: ATPase [Candidatus Tectomicrobia bacterium]|nr:ATPase [Candidatus Tectomicrobia bacterium]
MTERRLGEQLVADGVITEAQLRAALERQREKGGRIGENLVALGVLTPEDLAARFRMHPPAPLRLADTGLELTFVAELLLKHCLLLGDFTLTDLSERVKLHTAVVDEALEYLRRQKLVEVKGSADYSKLKYRFALTGAGGLRAAELLDICRYAGPAPVPLDAYTRLVRAQTVKHVLVGEESVRAAFAHLVVGDDLIRRLGPAVSAGKAIFVYGPPGNGKTTIAETIGNVLPGTVYIPYAVYVGGQIIAVYDNVNHAPAPPEEERGEVDQRWVLCRRPVVLAGGELTLRMLDLDFNTVSKYYEAPLQMKANNGLFIVDDFGRQLVEPRQLLNRWIVPLERRTDYLGLHTGMKFEIPFDQLVVFSTNLDPERLVDEAFLRRIRYKIRIDRPTLAQFEAIFRTVCAASGVEFRKEVFDHLVEHHYRRRNVELNACHPRDIVEHIVDEAHYRGHPPAMTADAVASAWESYFVT